MTVTCEIVVINKVGLHARPAAAFVKTAAGFKSKISVQNLDREAPAVNAKSILSLLGAGVSKDHRIRLTADGVDEADAIRALCELIQNRCGEAE